MIRTITLALAFIITGILQAQSGKTFQENYSGAQAKELSITNSFGLIEVTTHEKNEIEIFVEIDVVAKRESEQKKALDRINIDVRQMGERLGLSTRNDLNGINTTKMEINYKVKIPSTTNLRIQNSFGDVRIYGGEGTLVLKIQHGDAYVASRTGTGHQLKIQFGDLRVEDVNGAEIEVSHGDLEADKLNDVQVLLQFSEGSVDLMGGNSMVDVRHSELKIRDLSSKLSTLRLKAQFSDINIDQGAWDTFEMKLNGSFTDFSFPSGLNVVNREKSMHSNSYHILPANPRAEIFVDASHSDIHMD
jgi:hypothetical protein